MTSPPDPHGLESYYTDTEYLRELFEGFVAARSLPRRLLLIHGVSGSGKSSLLRMYRLHCKSVGVPLGLASADEQKSVLALLARWAHDLNADGVKLPRFSRSLGRYRAIQAEVIRQAAASEEDPEGLSGIVGNVAAKTAEGAAAAAAGAVVGSAVPFIGTVAGAAVGALVGSSGEALLAWLRGFLSKPDLDLVLDPSERLTDDFLADMDRVGGRRRLVLMLDTFEQASGLEDWVCRLAQRLHPQVLLVTAGWRVPDFAHQWPEWLQHAQVEELRPMSDDRNMRELVRRYYATLPRGRSGPDVRQVEAMVQFARGLPLVATTAVQLWAKYGIEDFQAVKPRVMADLADRLRQGLSREMHLALDAAAAVRWFNKPILRALTGLQDIDGMYAELERFPFVWSRAEGLKLHDAVRDVLDENLRVQDPEQHRLLHTRAVEYLRSLLEHASDAEAERLKVEVIYQQFRAHEATGSSQFCTAAEALVRNRMVNRLAVLVNDLRTYAHQLQQAESQLWVRYYAARLAQLRLDLDAAEKEYRDLSQVKGAPVRLRAYVLCDLGQLLNTYEGRSRPGGIEDITGLLYRSLQTAPSLDSKLVLAHWQLHWVFMHTGQWDQAIDELHQQLAFYEGQGDRYGVIHTLSSLKWAYAWMGNWREAFDAEGRGRRMLDQVPDNDFLEVALTSHYPWHVIWSGRYLEAERRLRDGIEFAERMEDLDRQAHLEKDIVLALGLQGKDDEAAELYERSMRKYDRLGSDLGDPVGEVAVLQGFRGYALMKRGDLEAAREVLGKGLAGKRSVDDQLGVPEVLTWLGELEEVAARRAPEGRAEALERARAWYEEVRAHRSIYCRNIEAAALAGLVRVRYELGRHDELPELVSAAEDLSRAHEYNEHLASLALTKGHACWEGAVAGWGAGFDRALHHYQQALVHALRFNRFALDEVLSGRRNGSALVPIIAQCRGRGAEGLEMLRSLEAWWRSAANEVEAPGGPTVSPIPVGMPLAAAEALARRQEPGDGRPQAGALDQLRRALEQ